MAKYQEFDDLTLSTKIHNVLDLILPTFGLEVNTAEDCGSYKSSEESVQMDHLDLNKTLIKDFYTSDKSEEERTPVTPKRKVSFERKEKKKKKKEQSEKQVS